MCQYLGKDTGSAPMNLWNKPPFKNLKDAFGESEIRVRNDKHGDKIFHFNSVDAQFSDTVDTFSKFSRIISNPVLEEEAKTVYLAEQPIPDTLWYKSTFSQSLYNQLKLLNLTRMLRANLWMGKGFYCTLCSTPTRAIPYLTFIFNHIPNFICSAPFFVLVSFAFAFVFAFAFTFEV